MSDRSSGLYPTERRETYFPACPALMGPTTGIHPTFTNRLFRHVRLNPCNEVTLEPPMNVKPITIEVPTTIKLTIKQPRLIPYLKTCDMRDWFDFDALKAQENFHSLGRGIKGDFRQLKTWQQHIQLKKNTRDKVLELHLPGRAWTNLVKDSSINLANPLYDVAIYMVAGKNFNEMFGFPNGAELFYINGDIYRRLTWQSITTKYWDKKNTDTGIMWKTGPDDFTYFLWKSEKINSEPYKQLVIDGIGFELTDRDRPKLIACKAPV